MEELLQAPMEGIWYEKEPPNSILTWDDLINKFVNQFFPPSKTTHLKNEISRFTQRFEETFGEAWERFKEMLRACPHNGFSELTQIDTFYNGLNEQDQGSLNVAVGGNLLSKTTREALKINENESKVRYSRCKWNVSRVNMNSRESSSKTDDRIDKLADQNLNLVEIVNKQVITPATVKAIEKSCVICGGAHDYYDCIATDSNQSSVCAATDFKTDPRVPLILGRSFLRTGLALIDVYGEEITLRVNDESVTFNHNQTMRYSSTYNDNSVNRIEVIDIAYEKYAQDVLDFKYNSKSGNPTLVSNPSLSKETKNEFCKEPIVKSSSPTLTPFGESDFLLEEIEDFLKDESIPTGIEDSYYNPEGDVLYLEKLLNEDPSQLPPTDLKQAEETNAKSSIEEPRITVDRAKVDVIAKLPHPTTVKGVMSFLGHAGFYRRFIQDFSKIARPMTHLLEKETLFVFSKDCIDAFETLKKKLTEAPILVVPDWNLPFQLMCDACDFAIDHSAFKYLLSKQDAKLKLLRWVLLLQEFDITIRDKNGLKNLATDHLSRLENPHKDVFKNKDINENFPLENLGSLSSESTPCVCMAKKLLISSKLVMKDPLGAIMVPISPLKSKEKFHKEKKCLKTLSKFVKSMMYGVEAKALPTNDARVVVNFLKSLFTRFGTPRAIISDRGTHFCNDQFAKVMTKYGVTHRLATVYHPQTSGQVEVSNRGLKRILEMTVGENSTSWFDKLDDTLWAFCTAFKTPIGFTPYKLVYEKSCHLPIELEHKAYWALKHVNFDFKTAGDHRKL
nr:reverse transcriptase domain-containing protein [Tanacetum cinerariifolium]